MSRDSVNREGLTFEEWVCAAGVARPNDHFNWSGESRAWPWVMPYCETSTYYTPAPNPHPGTVLLICGTSRPPPGIPHKHTIHYYSKKIREAWRNGEDPTEWRS